MIKKPEKQHSKQSKRVGSPRQAGAPKGEPESRAPKGPDVEAIATTESDITERKKAEEERGRLASIVESAGDAIISKDLSGIIQTWNAGAENIFGYKAEEVIGKPVSILIPPGHTDEVPEILVRIKQGENIEKFESERMRKDGRIIPVSLTFSPIKDASGKVIGASKIAHDITGRKQAEEQIKALNVALKHQVAKLHTANKELDSFAYSIAHDLRAPLRHMSGFVELLQKRLEEHADEKIRDYAAVITQASKKMGMLIDDLLNFSRLGRSEMHKRKVNLNALVSEVIREIQEELKGRDIIWEIDELPDVLGDQSLLRLVMVNLISNAVKFTSTCPQAEIKIGCKDEGDKFTCSVKDNGVGFDMKYVNKIFGVFQRLHTQNEFEGTGIGLAIVQRIIARHGGRVWADSVAGQGAAFYVTLPKIKEI